MIYSLQLTLYIEVPVKLTFLFNTITTKALLDRYKISPIPCKSALAVAVLDWHLVGAGQALHTTIDLILQVGVLHSQTTQFSSFIHLTIQLSLV